MIAIDWSRCREDWKKKPVVKSLDTKRASKRSLPVDLIELVRELDRRERIQARDGKRILRGAL